MERKKRDQFYLVKEDVLSESMQKTLEVKALLERGKAKNINDAVQAVGLSRSAYYKYRDGIYPFHQVVKENIVTLFFHLEDRSGTLSRLLALVASSGCNVLTIHQTIPLMGRANVSMSIDAHAITISMDELLDQLESFEAVEKVELIGSGA